MTIGLDQPEIEKEDSGSLEGEGEASAGGEKKPRRWTGVQSHDSERHTRLRHETGALSQQFVEQLDHKGDLVVTRLTAPLPNEQRRAIIGHSVRKAVVRPELPASEPTSASGATERERRERLWERSSTDESEYMP